MRTIYIPNGKYHFFGLFSDIFQQFESQVFQGRNLSLDFLVVGIG